MAKLLCVNVTGPNPVKVNSGSNVFRSIKRAASKLNRDDSLVLKASATHYQDKLNPQNAVYPSHTYANGSSPEQQALQKIALLAQNRETIDALISLGFSEDQISQIQRLHLLSSTLQQSQEHEALLPKNIKRGTESATPDYDSRGEEHDTDSADFCPACANLAETSKSKVAEYLRGSLSNTSDGRSSMQDPGDELAAIWAAAAALSTPKGVRSKELPPVPQRRTMVDQNMMRHYCFSDDDSSICRLASNKQEHKQSINLETFLLECLKTPSHNSHINQNGAVGFDLAKLMASNSENKPWVPHQNAKLNRRINTLVKDVTEIVKGIRFLQKMNENNTKINKIINEWRAVGMVLDRIFFYIYLVALTVCLVLFFPRSGNEGFEDKKDCF
ncbi:hypothetical protein Ciccas_001363 [Cichlidogyrus casuarinus]|uniref:Neurotransmitter-gated ion-channel transmembrane domain-containing protein n=1 Tax=Cichlidogyrus casuarinus TaxID=1844966 RepID=A0ABD2QKC5_9PLAT